MKHQRSRVHRESGTLYRYIMQNFLFFLLAVICAGVLIATLGEQLVDSLAGSDYEKAVKNQTYALYSMQYKNIRLSDTLGSSGYFEILDENANMIYSSKGEMSISYTPEILQFIPSVSERSYFYVEPVIQDGQAKGYVLSRYAQVKSDETAPEGSGNSENSILQGTAVLDPSLNVIYSNMDLGSSKLTYQELNILLENTGTRTLILKYEYADRTGSTRCLLLHIDTRSNAYRQSVTRTYTIMISIFVIILILLVMAAGIKISRTLREPVEAMESAMNALADGYSEKLPPYKGPKEFVHLMDSFQSMQRRLQQSEKEKREMEQQKQKMLADLAHDLKTPITVIRGYADAVRTGIVKEEDRQMYLDTISRKASLLSELINSLYEYSRLEHPDFRLEVKNGDLCECFREYLAGKYSELSLEGYELQTDLPEGRINMSFDDLQMRRVFENIISNSEKYNPSGTTIYASLKEDNHTAVFRIGDDGSGIPNEIRDSVFEPFIVGSSARTSGQGTGLGLSIAKKIIEAHGGTIRLLNADEYPKGTMYEIVLPLV